MRAIINAVSILILFIFPYSSLISQEKYSLVNIHLESLVDVEILSDLGIAADHYNSDRNTIQLVVNSNELITLKSNGFDYYLQEDDIAKSFVERNQNKLKSGSSFCELSSLEYGSVGGYHSYDEVIEIIQNLAKDYPEIVQLTLLGKSYEERDIYSVKISDNVASDESTTEGVAYFDALTHAREPLSMESTLFYMVWLAENYGKDRLVNFMVDNRELYFVPIVNPDGYVYNQTTDPEGGGGWRKNRRPINEECTGVDLNRNFSHHYLGPGSSSTNPCSELYRGVEATSEPETKLIQELIDIIKPKSAFSSHSFSQVMIDPDKGSPDHDFKTYSRHASEFTPKEYLGYGSAGDLINYLASGTTLDYLNNSGAIAWTPEIGTRFWESSDDICQYIEEMQLPMRHISLIAGAYPSFVDVQYINDGTLSSGDILEISIAVENKGRGTSDKEVSVNIVPLANGMDVIRGNHTYGVLKENEVKRNKDNPFLVELNEDLEFGTDIQLAIETYLGEDQIDVDIVKYKPGIKEILFEDYFENGLSNWINTHPTHPWSVTETDSRSGTHSLVESIAAYDEDMETEIVLAQSIDLSNASNPIIEFQMKHSFESYRDYVQVQISSDGDLWQSLPSTTSVSHNGDLNIFIGHSYWIQEIIDLKDFVGQEALHIKFSFTSNQSRATDGIYIDDFKVIDLTSEIFSTTAEEELANYVSVYPNPVMDLLEIELKSKLEADNLSILMRDALGRLWLKKEQNNFSNKRIPIDMSQIPQGIYYVSIKIDQNNYTQKVIKL